MDYRRYLDRVNKLRNSLRKTSLSSRRAAILISFFVVMLVILSFDVNADLGLEPGEKSPYSILSPKTFTYLDEKKTEQLRKEASRSAPDVKVRDERIAAQSVENARRFFGILRESSAQGKDTGEIVREIGYNTGVSVPQKLVSELLRFGPQGISAVEAACLKAIEDSGRDEITEDTLKSALESASRIAGSGLSVPSYKEACTTIISLFLKPNVRVDVAETRRRKDKAASRVRPVHITVRKNDLLIKKGKILTPESIRLLKDAGVLGSVFSLKRIASGAVLLCLLLSIASLYLKRLKRIYYDSPGLLFLLAGTVVVFTVLTLPLSYLSVRVSPAFIFLSPVLMVALLVSVLFGRQVSIIVVLICSVFAGVVFNWKPEPTVFCILGGMTPALLVDNRSTRHELRTASLISCFWLALVALGVSLTTDVIDSFGWNILSAFLGGVVFSTMSVGLLPFLETTFRITTYTWLLELASPEQPLLKELSLSAPGTYSHSVMVANLAEAAAREVGANPLLARVAAYYHDVGKIRRPQFFVENQPPGKNPHDLLKPSLSALIIISHVRDTVEILEKNHLPPDIVSIAGTHHGTSLIKYFYDRAIEISGEAGVDEGRFRYRAVRPKGKIGGILLLADSVEAAARTLPRKSAHALEQMIDGIIENKLEDGQLDESDITIRDLKKIRDAFVKILCITYHPRIEYPAIVNISGGAVGGKSFEPKSGFEPGKRAKTQKNTERHAS